MLVFFCYFLSVLGAHSWTETKVACFWENPKTDSWIQKYIRRFLAKSKTGSWFQSIHIRGGYFGLNPNPDFWDSSLQNFLFYFILFYFVLFIYLFIYLLLFIFFLLFFFLGGGEGFEKMYFWQSVFHAKMIHNSYRTWQFSTNVFLTPFLPYDRRHE